ncbi:MAG: hypothetical protein O2821_11745 [Chloroflexi bacterium]|nr:hypothetical protein [Chloroflexota bacterium]MDA1228679.1 hypothetical protein [Chloroflexota bacterium]
MNELKYWWKSIKSKLPPYYEVEGLLKSKEAGTGGLPFIIVNAASIEVDRVTFDRVAVGDILRVRYTRDAKAISIDRMTDGPKQKESKISPR